jgi:hypothetical protein
LTVPPAIVDDIGEIEKFFGWRGRHEKPAELENLCLKKIADLVMDMGGYDRKGNWTKGWLK